MREGQEAWGGGQAVRDPPTNARQGPERIDGPVTADLALRDQVNRLEAKLDALITGLKARGSL